MSLLFPAYLAGLLGLALPWLLHRFSDQQPEEQLFPSKQFLEPTTPPVSRKRQLKYLLLFALRILSVILLCLAFAQPWFARQNDATASRLHHIIAVDQSLSMRAEGRWDSALEQAESILDNAAPSDSIELIGFDRQVRRIANSENSLAAVSSALATLEPGYASADYGVLMQRLDQIATDQNLPTKLWLITDRQFSALPSQLNALYAPQIAQFELLAVSETRQDNIHLSAAAQSSDGVNVRITAQLLASTSLPIAMTEAASASGQTDSESSAPDRELVRDNSARDVRLQVAFGQQVLREQSVRVVPGSLETVVLDNIVLPASRNPVLQVSILESDVLNDDNAVDVVVRQANPTPFVLLESEADVSANAAVFAITALETDAEAQVEVISGTAERVPAEVQNLLSGRDFSDGDIELDVLQFVDQAGNALVFASANVQQPQRSTDADSVTRLVQGSEMGLVDESHPLALGEIDWVGTRFYETPPFSPRDTDKVLLETADRQAILIERPTARGQLLILNDRLDGLTSNLPLQPGFVSLMQSVLRYFDSSTALPDQVLVGHRLALPMNVQLLDASDNPLLTLDDSGRSSSVELEIPGLYKVVSNRGEHLLRVVTDAQEADLTSIDESALSTWQSRYANRNSGTDSAANNSESQLPDSADSDNALASSAQSSSSATTDSRSNINALLLAQGADPLRRSIWEILVPVFVLVLLLESWFANKRLDVRRDGS